MKKAFSFILILSLLISCLCFISVSADTAPFTFSVSTKDNTTISLMNQSCTVDLIFKISSVSQDNIKLVKISKGSVDLTSQNQVNNVILEKKDISFEYDGVVIPASDKNSDAVFTLTWSDGSSEHTTDCSIHVDAAAPNIKVYAEPEKLAVKSGDPLKIKYRVENTGNAIVSDIVVVDNSLGEYLDSTFILSKKELLFPGHSMETTVTVNPTRNIVFAPAVMYTFEQNTYEVKGDSVTTAISGIIPDVRLFCSNYSVEKDFEQTFYFSIHNPSEVKMTNIYIYNNDTDDAKVVYGPFDLEASETYSGSYTLNITYSGYYKCKVTYGTELDSEEHEVSVKSDDPIEIPSEVIFKISAITPELLTEPGDVTFTFFIENNTANMIEDMTISEASNLCEPVALDVIIPSAMGDKKSSATKDVSVHINSDKTILNFVLTYKSNGEFFTLKTSYEIKFNSQLSVPDETKNSNFNFFVGGLNAWIIASSVLLVAVGTFLVILIVMRKKSLPFVPKFVKRFIKELPFNNDPEDEIDNVQKDAQADESFGDEDVKIYTK